MAAARPSDLLIIGAGLAGISTATAAARQGFSVTLISALDRHPPDFRGEKLAEAQMATLDRLGLGAAARRQMTAFDGVWTHRSGRIASTSTAREYSSDYADLVNALAAAMPAAIERITGRVAEISTSADLQRLMLSDGRRFSGRLLAVATGLSDAIRRMLGIERVVLSAGHSLSLGYDLEEPAANYAFPSLVWGKDAADPTLSYLTLFPIAGRMRGNLFTYRGITDEWAKTFRRDPQLALRQAMPSLEAQFGRMTIAAGAVLRPIDVTETRNHQRDGVILLGDAFSVVCPITGMGMAKALNDADRLANHHLPVWLANPGMTTLRLAQFYADPAKTTLDGAAMRDSLVGRNLAVGETPYWRARRFASTPLRVLRDRIFTDQRPPPVPAVGPPQLAAIKRIG
jgi:2-polyprenyl-6-methoxyphenol hydroxylase-like FAD-dependent oxidoreductase